MDNTRLISFFTRLLGLRDPHANDHSNHVSDLSVALGMKLGMSSAHLERLSFAAQIHDIGKVAINEFVINKPGRFTEAEYSMIHQHTVLGANLIETLNLDPIFHLAILNHHENYDGSGYPNKIKGDQIPLEARIIRITDTYDALTSDRGYRPAYTPKEALAIMETEQSFFDPQLVETFLKIIPGKQ